MDQEKKYFAHRLKGSIAFVKVYNNSSRRKDMMPYFDTWAEAKQALLNYANRRLVVASRNLERARKYLINVYDMKEPETGKDGA